MLSSRATYALHCVAFLARKYPDSPVTLQEITEGVSGDPAKSRLSDGYVAKALAHLCRAGIIRGHVGRSGGYSLARRPCDVRVLDVVQALDGMQSDQCCLRTAGRGCGNEDGCAVRKMIRRAEATFLSSLAGQSLAAMARNMVFGNGSNRSNGNNRSNGKKPSHRAGRAARRSNRKSDAP